MEPLVFISHSSADRWVAGQIGKEVSAVGAEFFLDSGAIETGDEFDEKLKAGLLRASELLVLLTPAAVERPYVWIEIGVAWSQGKRIIGVLYGMSARDLAALDGAPAFLNAIQLRDINDLDKYFEELKGRTVDA